SFRMRSSSQYVCSSPTKKSDAFVLGPIIYPDNTGDAVTTRSSRLNTFATSPLENMSFRSPANSSKSIKKSKKSKTSNGKKGREGSKKKSTNRIKCEYSEDECPIRREKRDSRYKRDTMKKHLEGMDWRSGRDLSDLKKEIDEWKKKTTMSGDLVGRVDSVEKRLSALEQADIDRKKSIEMVYKNWAEFNRMKTQLMALEITQIKNRRGDAHRSRMPKEVAETTAKNLYKLCADLHRLTFHLNQKDDITKLVDEALTLAEVIAPLYGSKDEFVDSRENTSCNVSVSNTSNISSAESSPAPSGLYASRVIDEPSLRQKNPDYYSDKDLSRGIANCEPRASKESVKSQPAAAAAAAAASAEVPEQSPSSISISMDSDQDPLEKLKKKKKSRSFLEDEKK
ncbi:hypothetical protein PRIPAC_71545, partial [Pristionchus pacificus]